MSSEEHVARRLDFPQDAFEEAVYASVKEAKDVGLFHFKGAQSKDSWQDRVTELSRLCKEHSDFCQIIFLALFNLKADCKASMLVCKLAYFLSDLHYIFSKPDEPSMMLQANSICTAMGINCKELFVQKDRYYENSFGLSWFLGIIPSLPDKLHQNEMFIGLRITKEWLRYDFEHSIAIDSRETFDETCCAICQEEITDTALRIQRRCNKYPFLCLPSTCEKHECACQPGLFHIYCLSDLFFHQEGRITFAKCPTCNAEWCLQDLVKVKKNRLIKKQKK